jgi:hypothetical protein
MIESLPRLPGSRQEPTPSTHPCRASGADPEWWFPRPGDSVGARRAQALCRQCPVMAECLTAALARNEQFGVWGGATSGERRMMPRTHPCRRCLGPAALTAVYCGDECRTIARKASHARYSRNRRAALAALALTAGGAS